MFKIVLTISLLASAATFAAPFHLVEPSHWDNAISLEYGQTFEAEGDYMFGVRFYMRNPYNATGPFRVAVYSILDTTTPLAEKEFSSDGSGIDGLVEVIFDSIINTTVGDDYLFTIKRNTNETFDIGLYSMGDSYPEGDNAIRSGGEFSYSTRDISFDIISDAWSQRGSDIDGEAADDLFGWSVSLSTNGSVVAIGSNGNDVNGNNSGHVRVYQWDGSWSQLGSDIDGEAADDYSGHALSLNADGTVVAIGAPYNNEDSSGHVRVYQWDGLSWNQMGSDINGEAYEDRSGWSVSISADGTVVAIGAPYNDDNGNHSGHVRLYQWNGSSWSQLGNDIDGEGEGDYFGYSVSLSSDGSILAAGAYFNDSNGYRSGYVRLYEWDGSSWNEVRSAIEGEAAEDQFGYSVSLSADGSVVAIGAPKNDGNGSDSGHVRIFIPNDTDGDGLSNDEEINIHSTDPVDSDSDDDGLNDGDEIYTYSSDPNDSDSDDDGFNDGSEITLSLDPNVNNDDIVNHIKSNPSIFDLIEGGMTISEAQAAMRDLRIGSQTFDVSNGTATIRMYVDESSDLTSSWTNTQHVLEVDIPADQDTMFYRFRMD